MGLGFKSDYNKINCRNRGGLAIKDPYTTHHCDLYALVGWHHTRRQTHWLHVIYKALLSKVPPYLSSLVTIASPTCSTRSSRYIYIYISLWSPLKRILPLAASPSSSLLPMTGTNYKNLWNWKHLSPSLALSTSCQSSSQITAPVHSPSII